MFYVNSGNPCVTKWFNNVEPSIKPSGPPTPSPIDDHDERDDDDDFDDLANVVRYVRTYQFLTDFANLLVLSSLALLL
jgi:hypothetical protein